MATSFVCSFNSFYIYQVFILLFHKPLHPPSLFLSFGPSVSLFLWYPIPFSQLVVIPCGLEMLMFSCNPKLFAVRHIHYPVNPSSDHFHTVTDAVLPSSDHCCIDTVLTPSDHYFIETVAPPGDQYCINIVNK